MINPECQQKQEQNLDIINSLSSNYCYWHIYPFTKLEPDSDKQKSQQGPDLLIYRNNDSLTVSKLVKQYNQQFKSKTQTFRFFENGSCLKPGDTIKDVKMKLRKDNINGLRFYLYEDKELYYNECCVTETILNENKYRKLHFLIKAINYSLYLDIRDSDQIYQIKQKLSQQIKRIWGIKEVNSEMILFLNEQGVKNFIQNQTTIQVQKLGCNLALPKENKNFLIIKQSDQLIFKTTHFQLAAIESKKVIDLFKLLNPTQNWKEYGLKICDTIVKLNQVISQKCKVLFQKSLIHTKHLIGVVVKEVHIFQAEKSKIETKQFDIKSILVNDEKNLQIRSKIEQEIRNRVDKVSHEFFKGNFQNIEPIFSYTSQVKVRSSSGKRESSLYRVVNQFLRNQNFAETTEESYQTHWQYKFQCRLLSKIAKLPPLKPEGKGQELKQGWTDKLLWRGQNFKIDYEVGQIIYFKQFTSTTAKQSIAQGFAGQFIFKISKSKSGRFIEEFSYFKTQAEALFPSYTKFLVTKKENYHNNKKNKDIICYEIQEVEDKPPPPHQANFILWVDDKTGEGKTIWSQFTNFEHTTVMHQLVSTEQLQQWLTNNESIFKKSTQIVNVAMISNMRRTEKDQMNEIAGVQAIKVFRKFLPQGNIFLYIGNRQLSLQKLEKNGLFLSQQLKVSAQKQQLKKFLKDNIKID